MNNTQLGHKIGVSPSMASRLRAGKRLPGTATLTAIHEEFHIPYEELMAAHAAGPAAFGELLSKRIALYDAAAA